MSNLGPARARPAGRRETLSPARQDVLDLVVDAEGGMTVAEVAKATGAHPNTVREHLDALVQCGHLARAQLPAVGRGRPPMIYRAVPGVRPIGPEYRILAQLLIEHLAVHSPEASVRADHSRAAAEDWFARRAAEEVAAAQSGTGVPGTVPPELACGAEGVTLRLERCPVLDLARRYPEVVCSVHLGLLRGSLAGSLEVDEIELRPFAEPGACVLRLPPFERLPAQAFEFLRGLTFDGDGDGAFDGDGDGSSEDPGGDGPVVVGAVVGRQRVDA